MVILFISGFPKFSIAIGVIILTGILFKKVGGRFYLNFFIFSMFGWGILDQLGKSENIIIFRSLYTGMNRLVQFTGLTRYYNEGLVYFYIMGIILTVSDILLKKVIYYLHKKTLFKNKDKINHKTFTENRMNTQKPINKTYKNGDAKEPFDDLVLGVYSEKEDLK